MAIKISNTTVIDDSRNLTNIANSSSSNVVSTYVVRDASGNFSAGVVTATATSAQYADLAENYLADADYAPGTVLILGGVNEVTVTDQPNSTRVIGVVTTAPAYLMNNKLIGNFVVSIALTGRVPCQVVGPVNQGDILVTSDTPGFAVVNNNPAPGTIIGKSITTKYSNDKGTVEIVVGKH